MSLILFLLNLHMSLQNHEENSRADTSQDIKGNHSKAYPHFFKYSPLFFLFKIFQAYMFKKLKGMMVHNYFIKENSQFLLFRPQPNGYT